MIRLYDIQILMERWAPRALAFDRDNTGLQIGSQFQRIHKILVTLDLTSEAVDEAQRKRADLIISHHPPFFHPLKSIDFDTRIGNLASQCIKHGIAVYSAHTNLDFTNDGVSILLARSLGLSQIRPLKKQALTKKIITFVPSDHVDRVREAMTRAGAGSIGDYGECSFASEGTGTFRPNRSARPYIGSVGTLEHAHEFRLEMECPEWSVASVIRAMKEAHPYEEVAYDIYNKENQTEGYGAGAIGTLQRPMNPKRFLSHITKTLGTPSLRFSGKSEKMITHVAVCGGSGSDLIPVAIALHADAFVTSDISYHRFEEANDKLLFIDAGHFETEAPIVPAVCTYLKQNLANNAIQIIQSKTMKNHIQYFIP